MPRCISEYSDQRDDSDERHSSKVKAADDDEVDSGAKSKAKATIPDAGAGPIGVTLPI